MGDEYQWGHPGVCWPIKPVPYWVRQENGEWQLGVRTDIEESGFESSYWSANCGRHFIQTEEAIARMQLARAEEGRRRIMARNSTRRREQQNQRQNTPETQAAAMASRRSINGLNGRDPRLATFKIIDLNKLEATERAQRIEEEQAQASSQILHKVSGESSTDARRLRDLLPRIPPP